MIDTELMENRGIYIPNRDGVFNDVVAKVIGLTVNNTALDTARQPSSA